MAASSAGRKVAREVLDLECIVHKLLVMVDWRDIPDVYSKWGAPNHWVLYGTDEGINVTHWDVGFVWYDGESPWLRPCKASIVPRRRCGLVEGGLNESQLSSLFKRDAISITGQDVWIGCRISLTFQSYRVWLSEGVTAGNRTIIYLNIMPLEISALGTQGEKVRLARAQPNCKLLVLLLRVERDSPASMILRRSSWLCRASWVGSKMP